MYISNVYNDITELVYTRLVHNYKAELLYMYKQSLQVCDRNYIPTKLTLI